MNLGCRMSECPETRMICARRRHLIHLLFLASDAVESARARARPKGRKFEARALRPVLPITGDDFPAVKRVRKVVALIVFEEVHTIANNAFLGIVLCMQSPLDLRTIALYSPALWDNYLYYLSVVIRLSFGYISMYLLIVFSADFFPPFSLCVLT